MNRRTFLKASTALLATAALPAWAASKAEADLYEGTDGWPWHTWATGEIGRIEGFRWVEPYNGPDLRPVVRELTRRMTANMPDYSQSSLGKPWITTRRKIG